MFFLCLGQRPALLSDSCFLSKLDVINGPVIAGEGCLALGNTEEVSKSDLRRAAGHSGYICASFDPPRTCVMIRNLR